jgi:YVTN family beta-propeller protein
VTQQPSEVVGRDLGGYRIEAVLGRGGMGVVYRATDVRLGRKVALKVLPPEFGSDETFRVRFLRESRAAAAIDHPGVIPIYEAGDVDGQLYIAMRYVDGVDLERMLEADGPLAPERAVALVAQLAAALDAAHERGLVHRDVKPSNALVAKGDHVYLCDFGLTKEAADDVKLTASDELAGTALYMAPETLRTGHADARSDLYSLGCVLFECLVGEPPFTGRTPAAVIFGHLEEPPPPASERRAGLPHALDSVLARALDKVPEHRYASGAELVSAVRAALAGRAPARRRWPRAVAAAGAALAVAAAGAAALLMGSGETPSVVAIRGDAVAAIDPERGSLKGQVPLDGTPDAIAAGAGAVWVTDRDRNVVSRVDTDTRTIRQTIPVGHAPSAIAADRHGVWVANSQDGTVSVISPRTNQVAQTIEVGRQVDGLCAAGGAVWVASPLEYAVVRLDADTGRPAAKVTLDSQPAKLACGDGVVWASSASTGTVTRISASTATASQPVQLSRGVSALAVGDGAVWIANPLEGTVSRVDRGRGVVTATVPVGRNDGPVSLAVTPNGVWVANEFAGTLARIDPKRAEIAERLDIGNRPLALTVVDGALWLGASDAGARRRGGTVSTELLGSPDWTSMDFAVDYGYRGDLTNDGLTGYIRQGGTPTLAADLAEALPVPSDGGRTYAFRLRRGIRYSTGEPVRPSDVRFVIERGISNRGFADQLFSAIRGARACRPRACDLSRGIVTDDKAGTVVFHLTQPDGDLLYKLAMPFAFLLPPSVGVKAPANRLLPATGPYRVVRFDKGREMRLERNPAFRSWSPAVRPDGYPDAVVVRFGVPVRGAAERVSSGKVDLFDNAVERLTTPVADIRRRAPGLLRDTPAPVTTWFSLNTRVAPFDNVDARRAVAFAFDRRAAANALDGGDLAPPTCQLLPPGFAGFRPYCPFTASGTASGRPDLATARRLVERSGTRGAHVVVQSFDTLDRSVPEVMVRTLRRLGYDASLRVLPNDPYFDTFFDTSKRVQIGVHPWVADYPSPTTFFDVFACASIRRGTSANINPSQFCDRTLDRLVAEAKRLQVTDPVRAQALWSRAERRVVDQAPLVAAYNMSATLLVADRIGNYQFNWVWGSALLDQLWVR